MKVTGQTWLDGCQTVGTLAVKSLGGGVYAFTLKLTDEQNHQATLTEQFPPGKSWTSKSEGKPNSEYSPRRSNIDRRNWLRGA